MGVGVLAMVEHGLVEGLKHLVLRKEGQEPSVLEKEKGVELLTLKQMNRG